jgi:hypothetical protein
VAVLLLASGAACSSATHPRRVSDPCRFTSVAPTTLTGPAPAAIHGGRVSQSLVLDNGALRIDPAQPGDTPAITEAAAICQLGRYLVPPGRTDFFNGPIGFGRVTLVLSPNLQIIGHDGSWLSNPYASKPAWVVVGNNRSLNLGCATAPAPDPSPHGYGYEVWLLGSGLDVAYHEGGWTCGSSKLGVDGPHAEAPQEF